MIDRLVPIADDLEMAGALAERVRSIALALYGYGAAIAARAGILLADTKFEFGLVGSGRAAPDRRGHDARLVALLGCRTTTQPGRAQASYDKQFVRDYLESQPWNKTPPGPELPEDDRGRHPQALRRGLRADHRGVLPALPG